MAEFEEKLNAILSDPQAMGQIASLAQALTGEPFVKPERYAKVDKAVQIAKLARVIRVAFQLFQSRREEGKDDV